MKDRYRVAVSLAPGFTVKVDALNEHHACRKARELLNAPHKLSHALRCEATRLPEAPDAKGAPMTDRLWRVLVEVGDETVRIMAPDEAEARRLALKQVAECARDGDLGFQVLDVRPATPNREHPAVAAYLEERERAAERQDHFAGVPNEEG